MGRSDEWYGYGGRRHQCPSRMDTHRQHRSRFDECWVDVEAGRPMERDDQGRREAVMRVPGEGEGEDEVVLETMIQVSSRENYF